MIDEGDNILKKKDNNKILFCIRKALRFVLYVVFAFICILAFGGNKLIEKMDQVTNEQQKEDVLSKQQELEDKYGINIFVYEDEFLDRSSEVFERISFENNSDTIINALDDMDEILGRLPEGLLENNVKKDNVLDIYLCNKYDFEIGTDGRLGGLLHYYENVEGMAIILVIENEERVKKSFCHEIFHLLDSQISTEKKDYTTWNEINPRGYNYLSESERNHLFNMNLPYCPENEKNVENIFFVSEYSHSSEREDMAEIFSYLLYVDGSNELPEVFESPHVRKKVEYIIELMKDSYPCVDDNSYWERMYEDYVNDSV